MKIKDPVLLSRTIHAMEATYEVDVEGTKIQATYIDTGDEDYETERWSYDLSPCYKGLTSDEIDELDDDFISILNEVDVNE
jgi:hypothetical protein